MSEGGPQLIAVICCKQKWTWGRFIGSARGHGRNNDVIYNEGDVDRVADGDKVMSDNLWY